MQNKVREFMLACGQECPDYPSMVSLQTLQLRMKLIDEEVEEIRKALHDWDILEVIDGLCDLLYVTHGFACALGINIEPFFNAVHDANMAKVGEDGKVIKDHNGKVLKPEGWKAPQLEKIFREQCSNKNGN